MNNGKNAVKIGDTLHGYYYGFGASRNHKCHSFEVVKVGNKYFYDRFGRKYEISFDKRYYPQFGDLIAESLDPNRRYRYYKTKEEAERAYKVYKLKFALSGFNFHGLNDRTTLKVAELVGLEIDEHDE
ncbi:hypothetical protein [Enterococcus thailandicus]|uniref:hypothetical protein n=1 Tax=Enterococcus thailandicus TaxID=417368 RepID=UPI0034DD5B28